MINEEINFYMRLKHFLAKINYEVIDLALIFNNFIIFA